MKKVNYADLKGGMAEVEYEIEPQILTFRQMSKDVCRTTEEGKNVYYSTRYNIKCNEDEERKDKVKNIKVQQTID